MAEFYLFSDEAMQKKDSGKFMPGMEKVSMIEAFPFMKEHKKMISLVGAGGKTTYLYALAQQLSVLGKKTLVTTTTHIRKPEEAFYANHAERVRELWSKQSYAVIGREVENGKLAMPQELPLWMKSFHKESKEGVEEWEEVVREADFILIEADGAKCLPCKVPSSKEPVILPECDCVLEIQGCQAIGRTLESCCCRLSEVKSLMNCSEKDVLTEEMMARMLSHQLAGRKGVVDREYYMILNQCDSEKFLEKGRRVASYLSREDRFKFILSSFTQKERSEK